MGFFYATERTAKVTCDQCGRNGYGPENPTMETAFPWQKKCMGPHPFECSCGRRFATLSQRAGHVRKAKGEHQKVPTGTDLYQPRNEISDRRSPR
jgi:hypothetical protein